MKHELLTQIIPSGGSLGSWVDEKRSQLRDLMRIADTLSIDILNAHGGIGVSIPMPRLFEGCTSNEGQLPIVGVCTLVMIGQMLLSDDKTGARWMCRSLFSNDSWVQTVTVRLH